MKWFTSVYSLSARSNILNQFFDFVGFSNLFLAFVVFASTLQAGFVFSEVTSSSIAFSIINFVSAFFLYNLQRIYQSTQPTIDTRLLWYRKNKKWIFTIALLLVLVFSNVIMEIMVQYYQGMIVYGFCGLVSLFYFLPPFQFRKVKYIKQFAIACIWVVVCTVIPFMYSENTYVGLNNLTRDKWLYIMSQFCFISALCIPFDIRDMVKDKNERTMSLPIVLGIKKSKTIAIVLIVFYFILTFFALERSLIVIRLLIGLLSIILIYYANEKRYRYYFIFLTDGVILLQSLLLYFL